MAKLPRVKLQLSGPLLILVLSNRLAHSHLHSLQESLVFLLSPQSRYSRRIAKAKLKSRSKVATLHYRSSISAAALRRIKKPRNLEKNRTHRLLACCTSETCSSRVRCGQHLLRTSMPGPLCTRLQKRSVSDLINYFISI